jgi:uncharacterized protein YndB with AHSA1/START domain
MSLASNTTRVQQHVNAPRAAVYRALLNARAVQMWMVPDGMTSHVHEFDARAGGAFRISLTYDDGSGTGKSSAHTDTYHGHFLRLVRDEQVVQILEFESEDPGMQGAMTITFKLADANGGTDVLAIHESIPPGISPEDNETGWRMSLAKLATFVEASRG